MATRLNSVSDVLTKNPSIFDGRSDRQVLAHLQENWQSLGMVKCPDSLGQIPNVRKALGLCVASARNTGGERRASIIPTGLSSEFVSALRNAHALGGLAQDWSQAYQTSGPEGQKYCPKMIAELRDRLNAAPQDARFVVPFAHVRDADWKLLGLETPDMRANREALEKQARELLEAEISALRGKGFMVTTAPSADSADFVKIGELVLTLSDYSKLAEHFHCGGFSLWDSSDLGGMIAMAKAERLERERAARELAAEQARIAANEEAKAGQLAVAAVVAADVVDDKARLLEEQEKELHQARMELAAQKAELEELLAAARAAAIAKPATQAKPVRK